VGRAALPDYIFDGPRTDVSDVTSIWVDSLGGITRVRNAMNQDVVLEHGDPRFPALATRVVQPNGFTTLAAYDVRGHLDSTTAVNPYGASPAVNAVTKYRWDSTWDEVTRVTSPLGDTVSIGYRSDGRPDWRYDGGVRVTFNYGSTCNELTSVVYPDATRDSLTYDSSLCNAASSVSPLRPTTTYLRDAIGRLIRTTSPIDSAGTKFRTDSVKYGLMDEVLRTWSRVSTGTAVGPDSLVAVNVYDAEGNLTNATQEAFPHLARSWARSWTGSSWTHPDLGALARGYSYDSIGRRTFESSGSAGWHTYYDVAGNVTVAKDNGLVTRTYDALNRPIARFADDSSTFTYDPVSGWLTAADNEHAQIRRGYYPNGALKVDTLRIQKAGTSTPNFYSHVYITRYEYDLNGRRKQVMNHLGRTTTYEYDPRTGNPSKVVDVAGNAHRFRYDQMGRLDTLIRLSGRADSVVQGNSYDAAGRLKRRVIKQTGVVTPIYSDTLGYDARDKVLSQNVNRMTYSPLGTLATSTVGTFGLSPEEFQTDALGLHRMRKTIYHTQRSTSARALMTDSVFYLPGTMSIAASVSHKDDATTPDTTEYGYDNLGNQAGSQTVYHLDPDISTPPTDETGRRNRWGFFRKVVNLYDRENRLVKTTTEKDTIFIGMELSAKYIATETYKYDALGRRVWVRSIKPSTCVYADLSSGCHSTDTRTVWDGDQILSEERDYPSDEPTGGYRDFGTQYGIVQYTHAGAIDEPLTILGPAGWTLAYADFRGGLDKGTCVSATCGQMVFSAGSSSAYRSNASQAQGLPNWYGSLPEQMTDASGFQYKRNRYYDPTAGTFTQEDPIGIAGGFNTYGFANGDPVSYSDPFGLMACPPMCGDAIEYSYALFEGAWNRAVGAFSSAANTVNSAANTVNSALEANLSFQADRTQLTATLNSDGVRGSADLVANPHMVNLSAAAGVRLSPAAPGATRFSVTGRVARVGPASLGIRGEFAAESTGAVTMTGLKGTASVGVSMPGWTQQVTPSVQVKNIGCAGAGCPAQP
jgi:RHS repeat-associated protein